MSQDTRNQALAATFSKAERAVWRGVQPFPGSGATRIVAATFDATGGKTKGVTYGLNVRIPKDAIIIRAWRDVLATFTSSTDAETIAIQAESANDIVTATAISAGGDIWDKGVHSVTLAALVKMTTEKELSVVLGAGENLTAGKMIIFVEYVQSQPTP